MEFSQDRKGYYSSYKLSVLEGGNEKELIKQFRNECVDAKYALDENGFTNRHSKWYSSRSDLVSFSTKHPDVIFCLEGDGEETGRHKNVNIDSFACDMWKLYVKNGHSQECRASIKFPEFDKGKLLAEIRNSKINKII